MKHQTSAQRKRIEAEVQARRARAIQDLEDKKRLDQASALIENDLGGTLIDET